MELYLHLPLILSVHHGGHWRRELSVSANDKWESTKGKVKVNQPLRHEDVWVSVDIAPRILNLGTKW
jgi:predicted class III extradiol MEMO1 family dioxygenase